MSTKSGPYSVFTPSGEEWHYQHDMMGNNFDGSVFYVWGPGIYIELPIDLQKNPRPGWPEWFHLIDDRYLGILPSELVAWLRKWPSTPDLDLGKE